MLAKSDKTDERFVIYLDKTNRNLIVKIYMNSILNDTADSTEILDHGTMPNDGLWHVIAITSEIPVGDQLWHAM